MTTVFELAGLSCPDIEKRPDLMTGTCSVGDCKSGILFTVKIRMADDRKRALWDYCGGEWWSKKQAIVEHEGFYDDGQPISPVMVQFID